MNSITVINQDNSDQFTFYDNDNGTTIKTLEGFEYADVREVIEDVAGDDGAIYITSKFGRRRFSWSGDLVSAVVYELRREMLSVLRQTGRMKLIKFTTYDDLDLQVEAEIVKVLNPYTHSIHTYLIEAIAPDPRFYSQSETEYETAQTVVSGGSAIPADVPMSLYSAGIEVADAINVGNEVTDPVFKVHGPGTFFTVGNQETGEVFTLDYTLNDEEYIEIDVKNRTVKLNGVTNTYSAFSGDFWQLQPGGNTIRFVASGLGVETLLTITYRDAYNGL